jgi:hypothetical protein
MAAMALLAWASPFHGGAWAGHVKALSSSGAQLLHSLARFSYHVPKYKPTRKVRSTKILTSFDGVQMFLLNIQYAHNYDGKKEYIPAAISTASASAFAMPA